MSESDLGTALRERALKLAREVYAEHSAGCCLHVLLDDGNTSDRVAEFCVNYATEAGHPTCIALAKTLNALTKTQRNKVRKELHA